MRVLITQPAQQAAISARALAARGHEPISIPLVTVDRETAPQINLTNAQGFLAVSAEGVRALADLVGVRTFPIFVESELTAAEARRLGFKDIHAAKDDSQDLARLVERTVKPANGALIYACSTAAPVNLPTMLGNMGFAIRALPLYSIKRVEAIPQALRARLSDKTIDVALFLSPDEARAFVTLMQRDETAPSVAGLKTVAATPAIAAPMRALKGASVTVAAASDPDTVWATLDGELIDKVEEERRARARAIKDEAERQRAEEARVEEKKRAEEARGRKDEEDERARAETLARENAERERLKAERTAREQDEREQRAKEQAERERLKAEEAARAKAEKERLAAERAARELAEREQRAKDQVERERLKAEEAARAKAAKERLAAERAAREQAEREQLEKAQAERERLRIAEAERARIERERVAAKRAEQVRLQKEKEDAARREQAEAERLRQEQLAREQAERARIAAEQAALEKAAHELRQKEEAARDAAERARLAAERTAWEAAEQLRLAAEKAERDRLEAERLVREQEARALRERERAERDERDSLAREEAERVRLESARLAREREAEREALERAAHEEAEKARAEAERLTQERAEADRLAREKIAEAERLEEARRVEAARLEEETRAEAARLEAEKEADAARLEAEKQAEAARLEKAARAEAERLENEARAEEARIAREKRAEEIRLENERLAAEKAERERQKAIEAAAAEERKRIAREEAATHKARADQARREEAARQRAEQERLALELAERRRKDQEEAAAKKAERTRVADAQKQAAKAEKERRAAERPPSAGLTAKFSGWFGAKKSDPAPDPRWTMVVGESDPPQASAESIETSTAVASADPSWNDTPMTEPPRPSEPLQPAQSPPPESSDGSQAPRIPAALRELNELVERENPAAEALSLDDAKPAARGGGGRSAQMLAEDAADDRARDRIKNWGRETPANEPPVSEPPAKEKRARDLPPRETEPAPEGIPETMTAPLERRRGPGRTIALFFVLATISTAALMTSDRWIPLLDGVAETPVATAPAPQTKPSAPTPAPTAPTPTAPTSTVPTPAPSAPVAAPPAPAPQLPAGDTNQVIAALMARVATLEAALGNTAGLDEINRRVGALEGKSADANSVLALADRVTALEQGARSAADARAAAVALTIAGTQWREAIVTGRPFLKEWDTVKALTGDTETNTIFAPYASTGLPVLADLQRRFDLAAAAAVRASYIPDDTASWLRRTLDRVLSVVTVRRTDLDTGDEIDAVLVRAERAVDANNLSGAIVEMKKLTGAPLTAAGPWITLAEARVAAEEAAQQTVIDGTTAIAAPVAPAAPVALAPAE